MATTGSTPSVRLPKKPDVLLTSRTAEPEKTPAPSIPSGGKSAMGWFVHV